MIEILEKKDCCGCHACTNICPKKCISMDPDEEGFLYPNVNHNSCIKCGLCKSVCPILTKQLDIKKEPKAYACFNKNEEIRSKSSSGGVFSALADHVLESGGGIFGAGFNKDMEVIHQYVDKKEDLDILRMSKYVQSRIGETYKKAQELLDAGRKVLFSGTPCQIEGLKKFLRKDYENLLTQDLICHGVPSPAILKGYLKHRSEISGSKVSKVEFRSKVTGWKKFSFLIKFENQTIYKKNPYRDQYMNMFLFNKNLRPSCHDCKFKKISRVSDITLADFWGVKNVAPDMDDNKGTSLVLIHSEKGAKFFEEIKDNLQIIEVDFQKAIKRNPMIKTSCKSHIRRTRLMRDFNKIPFKKFLRRHGKFII